MSDDTDKVLENPNTSLQYVAQRWPNSPVAFSSLIPGRGSSEYIKIINDRTKLVDSEVLDFCKCNKNFNFLNNDLFFFADGTRDVT